MSPFISAGAAALAALAVLPSASVNAFYLPGSAPRSFAAGDPVPLLVNALSPQIGSKHHGLQSLLSYDYYNPAFHFCRPGDGKREPQTVSENLGSVLFGDRLYESPFDIRMMRNSTCQLLCESTVPAADAKFLNERIKEDYAMNWLVDGLPVAEMLRDVATGEIYYSIGFELGSDQEEEKPQLYNHYNLYIEYHRRPNNLFRVVGVSVWPTSADSRPRAGGEPACESSTPLVLSEHSDNKIYYTYSVNFIESEKPWATRWDSYLKTTDSRVHWFSLINSTIICVFLCVMVGMILLRTVNRDVSRYNAIDLTDDIQEDFGWKLVHAEVFRQPQHPMLLAIANGSGGQVAVMLGVAIFFALLGFLSPSNRGSLSTVMIVCWTLCGVVAGYVSTRLYASFGGQAWKQNVLWTATLFPTILFATLNLLNFFLIGGGSSGAVPFGTLLSIVALWFLISAPLTALGSVYGIKKGPLSHPVRVNQIPRQIPPQIWYLRTVPSAIMAGVLPFGAAFIEIYFVLSSLFGSKAFYAFGFLALTCVVVALTTATVTILMTYLSLCSENWRWHWRSFLIGGGSAFWLLGYGLLYGSRLHLDGISSKVLYLGYLFIICLVDFVVCGTIGYLSTYAFLRLTYSQIRVD